MYFSLEKKPYEVEVIIHFQKKKKKLKLKGAKLLPQSQTACKSHSKDSNPVLILKNPHLVPLYERAPSDT